MNKTSIKVEDELGGTFDIWGNRKKRTIDKVIGDVNQGYEDLPEKLMSIVFRDPDIITIPNVVTDIKGSIEYLYTRGKTWDDIMSRLKIGRNKLAIIRKELLAEGKIESRKRN